MSQTTRCPACHTRFKVVADQLRISDGWVRCGSCKQVFDAAVSLLPAASEPMLPDIPLNQLRGPVTRATTPPPLTRAWGGEPASPPESRYSVSPSVLNPDVEKLDYGFWPTQPGLLEPPQPAEQQHALPAHVPTFLTATTPPPSGFPSPEEVDTPESGRQSSLDIRDSGNRMDPAWQTPGHSVGPGTEWPHSVTQASRGYELPGAKSEESDSGWPALFDPPQAEHMAGIDAADARARASTPGGGDAQELDLAHFIAEVTAWSTDQPGTPSPTLEPPKSPAPTAPIHLDDSVALEDSAWTLVRVGEPAELLQKSQAVANVFRDASAGAPQIESGTTESARNFPDAGFEPSFVRDARRHAFWSGAGVRAGMLVTVFVLLSALAAQLALHDRARWAAQWPQVRSLLTSACEHLQCTVGSYQDIRAIVVDGSSFNRVQGDRYQFALTLRNRTAVPVEAPAIELTLTDTDEQPVLRRILMPAELAAPNPLLPGNEWSAVLPMAVATGAPRIAGYRVLAFYP